ncbi:MAG: DUF5132 domain-containing protein [Pseudomonadota bacterium]
MGFFADLRKNASSGLLIGIGAAVLAPVLLPILASIARPLAKATIKSGLMLYEKGKETLAEAGEMVEDLMAEVKVEMAEEQEAGHAFAAGAASVAADVSAETQASSVEESEVSG